MANGKGSGCLANGALTLLLLAVAGWMAARDADEFVNVPVKGVADCTW